MTATRQEELDEFLKNQYLLWFDEERYKFALDHPTRRREWDLNNPDGTEEDWEDAEHDAWEEHLATADWPSESRRLADEFLSDEN